jgi:hypothetical protein
MSCALFRLRYRRAKKRTLCHFAALDRFLMNPRLGGEVFADFMEFYDLLKTVFYDLFS